MVHGKNRIPYWIDRRLKDLAGPEYHAIISFGLPIEPEDSQYGKSRSTSFAVLTSNSTHPFVYVRAGLPASVQDDLRRCPCVLRRVVMLE